MLIWPLQSKAAVDLSWGCTPSCAPGNWPNVDFAIFNDSNPATLKGFRFKTNGVNNYSCWPAASITGGPVYQYQIDIPATEQVLALNETKNYGCSGNVGVNDGTPFDGQILLKEGACDPPVPALTPTPVACSQVDALIAQPDFYNPAVCVPDWLGKNGGVHSGGLLDTFYGQTQITAGLPSGSWTISGTNVRWDPNSMSTHSSALGQGPMYMMASAMGQELFSLDMQFLFGIGAKEAFAAMVQVPGSELFIPSNAAGVNGTYHVETFTFGTIVAAYPVFFPDYACMATFPNVTTAMSDPVCMPGGIAAMGDFYMTTSPFAGPYLASDSAQLVNSVMAGGFNFFRLYDALMASENICFRALLEGPDDEAAVKFLPAGYNLGINSGFEAGINTAVGQADVTPWTVMGNSNYRDQVLETAHQLEAASSCGGEPIYDAPITLSDLESFFFGNGGTVGAQADGGLMLHFGLNSSQRQAMWDDVVCAFNKMDGMAPSTSVGQVSFRYDFLTLLRVARQHLATGRPFPTQSDFTDWVNAHSGSPATCGITSDTTFPYVENVTPPYNSDVCPDFTVTFDTWDETALDKVEWTLDPNWISWNSANSTGGNGYDFTVPGSDINFPASGPFTVWIKSTDTCANATIHPLLLNHNCGTPTPTPTPTYTATPTYTVTLTPTPTYSRTSTPSASPSPTVSPSPTGTPTYTVLDTPTPTATQTATVTVSATPSDSHTPTLTPTPTPTLTRTSSPSASPSATVTLTVTPTLSPSATPTVSVTPSQTPTPSPTFTDSPIASDTVSPTITPTVTVTSSPSNSPTPVDSLTATPSVTGTVTRTASPTITLSHTASPIASDTVSPTISPTPSRSATPSATGTPTSSLTVTATRTASPTASMSHTASPIASDTVSPTISPTPTATATATRTATPTATPSVSPSATLTFTASPIASDTVSPTLSPTPSATRTATATVTVTSTHTPVVAVSPSPTGSPAYFQQERLIQIRGLYPNPFSEELKIFFTLRVAANVQARAYNVAGEVIWSEEMSLAAGKNIVRWQGENYAGARSASGVYLLVLDATGVDGTFESFWERAVVAR